MNCAQKLLVSIQRELDDDVVTLGDAEDDKVEVIPTGFDTLNQALGIGGYPRGRMVEVFGPESSGKSTLVLHALREAQGDDGLAALIDADRAFDATLAKTIGVKLDRLLVSRPDHAEQALNVVEHLVRSGAVALIAIDSVPALVPQVETEAQMGDDLDGQQARLMSRALRRLLGVAHRTGTVLLWVNQLRHAGGVTFGSQEATTGGHALKHYASVRLDLRRVGPIKVGEECVGLRTRAKIVKNKLAVPFREAELELRWGTTDG